MRNPEEGKIKSAGAAGGMPKAGDDERHGKPRLPVLPSRKVHAGPHPSDGSREGWGPASLATRVDGIYAEDPEKNPHAVRYSEISYQDFLSQNLQVMDATAIHHCR